MRPEDSKRAALPPSSSSSPSVSKAIKRSSQQQQPNEDEPSNHQQHPESNVELYPPNEQPLRNSKKKKARITTISNIYHDDNGNDDNEEEGAFHSNGDRGNMHQEQQQQQHVQYQQYLQYQMDDDGDKEKDENEEVQKKPPPKQQPQQQQFRQVQRSPAPAAATASTNKHSHLNNHHIDNDDDDDRQIVIKPPPSSTSPSDRIILDVGGTEIVTSLRTLTSNSSYFASVFSNTWLPSERPFLDQDAQLFTILLNFMRSGYIEDHVLTKPLLLQAAYLGMDRLLQAVMVLAYRNAHPDFTGNDAEAMQAFGMEYGDVVQATCQGHLPAMLFQSSQEPPKEYASLYFHKAKVPIPHMVAPQYRTGIRTSVLQTPDCATLTNSNNLMLEWSDAGGYFLPVFALNYLGKRGFTLADGDLQGFWDPRRLDDESEEIALGLDSPRQLGRLLGEVLFVRYQEHPTNTAAANEYYDESVTNVILTSRIQKRWTAQPKEYATVNYVKCVDGCVFIQAAGGVPRRVPRLAGEYLRDTGRLMCKSIALAMDWLQQHGFTHNEPQLEALLTRIGNEAKDDYYGPTMVFSRPLNEKEPLLPCRLVNVDFAEETSHLRGHAARHG